MLHHRITRRQFAAATVATLVLVASCAESPTPPTSSALAVTGVVSNIGTFTGRLFATDGARNNPTTLYELNPATGGVVATIGFTGFSHLVAIDFDPTSGTLYGIVNAENFGGGTDQLVTLSLTTGAATVVTPITWPNQFCVFDHVPDMSFNSAGELFAWREPCDDDMYRIDKVTGVATKVGEAFLGTGAIGVGFDVNDNLYIKNFSAVYKVNTTTGAATFISSVFGGAQNMLAFDGSNVAYTGQRSGATSILKTLNITTGALTNVGVVPFDNLAGLAFQRINNQPPVANAGGNRTVEATSPAGAVVLLDGSASSDPDGDALSYTWSGPFGTVSGVTANVSLGFGANAVSLTVTDPSGASHTDNVVITIVDTTAPTITTGGATTSLWPPNHKMVTVITGIQAADIADPNPSVTVTVTSSEPVNGLGDGDTAPDWNVISGSGGLAVEVRAERSGKGPGRTYTITITATDVSGNSSTGTFTVTVPSSMK